MDDPTEPIRRARLVEIDAAATSREYLEARYGWVWDTAELTTDFTVIGFATPLVVVRRREGEPGVPAVPATVLQLRGASPAMTPKFHLGQIVATPGALEALAESGVQFYGKGFGRASLGLASERRAEPRRQRVLAAPHEGASQPRTGIAAVESG